MVARPGSTLLDPFAGSGTTLVAAIAENVNAVGIEQDPSYAEICRARVAWAEEQARGQTEEAPVLFAEEEKE